MFSLQTTQVSSNRINRTISRHTSLSLSCSSTDMETYTILSLLCLSFIIGTLILRAHRRTSTLSELRGPESPSFWLGTVSMVQSRLAPGHLTKIERLLGNQPEYFYQKETGESEFKWLREYGTAWRVRGCMGVGLTCQPSVLHPH